MASCMKQKYTYKYILTKIPTEKSTILLNSIIGNFETLLITKLL